MRPGLLLALIAMACAPAPAMADVTARYRISEGQTILIEASDDGHGRFTPEGEGAQGGYAVFTPEDSFLVFTEQGVTRVIRFADFRAALDAVIEQALAQVGGAGAIEAADPVSAAPAEARLETAGRSEVNGRSGIIYRDRTAEADMRDFVISDDPALAPVGRIFAKILTETPMLGNMIGGAGADWKRELAALLDKGAALRLGEASLESMASEEIPAERFGLPSAPISREEFQRLLLNRQQGAGPAVVNSAEVEPAEAQIGD